MCRANFLYKYVNVLLNFEFFFDVKILDLCSYMVGSHVWEFLSGTCVALSQSRILVSFFIFSVSPFQL